MSNVLVNTKLYNNMYVYIQLAHVYIRYGMFYSIYRILQHTQDTTFWLLHQLQPCSLLINTNFGQVQLGNK